MWFRVPKVAGLRPPCGSGFVLSVRSVVQGVRFWVSKVAELRPPWVQGAGFGVEGSGSRVEDWGTVLSV